jgi:MFS family permease
MLLATRVLLGGLLAVNGPVTASLLGDLWPAAERGRIYGLITSGELVGAGIGFFASGELAAVSWRLSFLVLALPAVLIAWSTFHLPEPERMLSRMSSAPGGAARPSPRGSQASGGALSEEPAGEGDGDGSCPEAALVAAGNCSSRLERPAGATSYGALSTATAEGASVANARTLRDAKMSSGGFWQVVSYVLSIRTNVVLVVAGGLTWMFLSAVESFGEEFVKEQYHIGQLLATLVLLVVGAGAVLGASVGGQSADQLVRKGWRAGRMTVAAAASLLSAVVLVPALLTGSLLLALPLLIVAGGGLAAANPPIDATRIEVVSSSVWGRAEAVRSVLRMAFQAVAPLTAGFVADSVGHGHAGLQVALLVLVALLVFAGMLLIFGHFTYPRDRIRAVEVDNAALAK